MKTFPAMNKIRAAEKKDLILPIISFNIINTWHKYRESGDIEGN
jgi:hypothetical protein